MLTGLRLRYFSRLFMGKNRGHSQQLQLDIGDGSFTVSSRVASERKEWIATPGQVGTRDDVEEGVGD